jgi:hypothetical protein
MATSYKLSLITISLIAIILILSFTVNGLAYSTVTVRVLIHSGTHASSGCVNGTVDCLSTSNATNLVTGVWFTWGFSGSINSTTLAPYDVLVMPGGDGFGSGYRQDPSISSTDIRNWVASGKGYFGTCAGAYGGTFITEYNIYFILCLGCSTTRKCTCCIVRFVIFDRKYDFCWPLYTKH